MIFTERGREIDLFLYKKASRKNGSLNFCHTDISVYGVAYVLKTKQLLFLGIKFFLSDDSCIKKSFIFC